MHYNRWHNKKTLSNLQMSHYLKSNIQKMYLEQKYIYINGNSHLSAIAINRTDTSHTNALKYYDLHA